MRERGHGRQLTNGMHHADVLRVFSLSGTPRHDDLVAAHLKLTGDGESEPFQRLHETLHNVSHSDDLVAAGLDRNTVGCVLSDVLDSEEVPVDAPHVPSDRIYASSYVHSPHPEALGSHYSNRYE